jgi:hypothetical protein
VNNRKKLDSIYWEEPAKIVSMTNGNNYLISFQHSGIPQKANGKGPRLYQAYWLAPCVGKEIEEKQNNEHQEEGHDEQPTILEGEAEEGVRTLPTNDDELTVPTAPTAKESELRVQQLPLQNEDSIQSDQEERNEWTTTGNCKDFFIHQLRL